MRAIARHLGIARDTVARAVVSEVPPKYVRPPVPSQFDEFEPRVRDLLREFPVMPASVVAERVGWTGSASCVRKRIALVRVECAPRDPADRIDYQAGDQAQCDLWFPPGRGSAWGRSARVAPGVGDRGLVRAVHHCDHAARANDR